jgi:methylglutaconyl-CoA hydratase
MSKYTTIQICDDTNVRTIKLNRPEKRNALNSTMIAELTSALDEAADGPCGAVILTGAGKCFCAGLDLEELRQMESRTIEEHLADAEQFARLIRLLYDFPKPTIAAVNGSAIAGGCGLATVCDFTYASQDATFGYTEVRIGFVPAIVSSFREAFNLGLCLLKNSPEAMRWTKGLLCEHVREDLDREIADSALWNARAKQNDDFREGIHAFLEKRPPEWPSLHKKTSRFQPV